MSSPLSGFTAVPNPQMLAFMGAQSFIMMFQAGEGWQYGKRKISAMSNEEFNKLTPEIVMEKQAVVLRNSLGTIQKSMNDMTPMIRTIVEQYGDFIHEIIKAIPQIAQNVLGSDSETGKFSSRPGTPAFITPIIPFITPPGTRGAVAPPFAPGTTDTSPSPRIISISQLRSMSYASLLDLRRNGNLTIQTQKHLVNVINEKSREKRTNPAPIRAETSTDTLIFNYMDRKANMFKNILREQKIIDGTKIIFGRPTLLAWQVTQISNHKKIHKRLKAEWYRFMQQSRNSPIHQIKIDATRAYQSRPFKVYD